MAETYPMPKWGLSMEEGVITEWQIEPGQPVTEGQVLALVETDKIEVELESPVNGVFARALAADGDEVKVGTPVMVIAADEADYASFAAGS
ncbi:hypothetical protein J4573_52375 [Actinomadura barringtoniae]|uniref:Lipoyl-binding domain-containing protein n=1 Tax=Actinomadura barringtoniae TaxID=1427535 RepID=A0A939TGT7_9ACTN|nr:biotin/lipoyl-containing protein [Actinomadura barringtoniae]MBO2455755.1 hypothetical protein [Actinomadura barringtoniae]